jgi:hypothetical protein
MSIDVCFMDRACELLGRAVSSKLTARLVLCDSLTAVEGLVSETSERIDRGTSSARPTTRLSLGGQRLGEAGGEEGRAGDDAGAGAGLDEMIIVSGPPGWWGFLGVTCELAIVPWAVRLGGLPAAAAAVEDWVGLLACRGGARR